MYTDIVKDHFIQPKNHGSIDSCTATGEVGNVLCGDTVKLYINVKDGSVLDAKFQSYGCVYSIACADMTADLVNRQDFK